jgi:hypothetical protein
MSIPKAFVPTAFSSSLVPTPTQLLPVAPLLLPNSAFAGAAAALLLALLLLVLVTGAGCGACTLCIRTKHSGNNQCCYCTLRDD